MKTITRRQLVIATLIVIGAIAVFQVFFERVNLAKHSRVTIETGLTLPEGTRIVATAAHTFSLVDGDNYEWLIESDTPFTQWIQLSSMHREDGDGISWASVTNFGEIAEIARDKDRELALHSVWRSDNSGETAYLYVASGQCVALLETFRP